MKGLIILKIIVSFVHLEILKADIIICVASQQIHVIMYHNELIFKDVLFCKNLNMTNRFPCLFNIFAIVTSFLASLLVHVSVYDQ